MDFIPLFQFVLRFIDIQVRLVSNNQIMSASEIPFDDELVGERIPRYVLHVVINAIQLVQDFPAAALLDIFSDSILVGTLGDKRILVIRIELQPLDFLIQCFWTFQVDTFLEFNEVNDLGI